MIRKKAEYDDNYEKDRGEWWRSEREGNNLVVVHASRKQAVIVLLPRNRQASVTVVRVLCWPRRGDRGRAWIARSSLSL